MLLKEDEKDRYDRLAVRGGFVPMCINSEKAMIQKGLIDLHLHLDGSISVQCARELARIEGVTLPGEERNQSS